MGNLRKIYINDEKSMISQRSELLKTPKWFVCESQSDNWLMDFRRWMVGGLGVQLTVRQLNSVCVGRTSRTELALNAGEPPSTRM